MGVHVEWANADGAPEIIAPGEFEDAYGTKNDAYVLLLGTDSIMAIEGTIDQLERLAQRITYAVRDARAAVPVVVGDVWRSRRDGTFATIVEDRGTTLIIKRRRESYISKSNFLRTYDRQPKKETA